MKTQRPRKTVSESEQSSPPKAKSSLSPDGQSLLVTYEHAPVGIVECSPDGNHLRANEEFCRLLGYGKDELLGKGIKSITHEDDYPIDIKLHQQLVEGKIPYYRLEKRYIRKDGEILWVELTRSVVRDAAGRPLYTVGVVLDISDRKHVERVLRDSSERLRLATETARMFMWELDLESRVYTFADNFERVLGFSGGLLPKNSMDAVQKLSPAEDAQLILEEFRKAIESHDDLHALQYRMIDPESGQIVWLEANAKIVYDETGFPERMFGVTQNVTERKKAQEEITIVSRMPEENPNPVMRLTQDGSVIYANSPSASLLKPAEGNAPRVITRKLKASVEATYASGVKQEVEIENGGKVFTVTLAPISGAGYVNFYGNDITERKQAEKALRESEERLRATFNTTVVGFATLTPQAQFIEVNDAFCHIVGYSRDELIQMNYAALTHPDNIASTNEHIAQLLAGQVSSFVLEKIYICKDGTQIWVQNSVSLARDIDGQPLHLIAICQDITERKRFEEKLRQAAAFDEAVMSNMVEGLYTVDSEGRVVSMNPAAEKIFGWTLDELRGRRMHDVTHYKHLDGTPFPVEECASFQVLHHGHKLVGHEDIFIRKDGTFFDAVYSSAPLWENGKISGLVVVFSDNTIRKQSERRLVLLSGISDLVRRLDDPNELLFAVSKAVGEHLRVRRCLFNEIDVDNDIEIVHRDYCRGVESVAGVHKISDYSSVTSKEMEAGKTVVNHDSKLDPRTAPDYERAYVQYGERAYVTVPLLRENRWVASLWVSDDQSRVWSKEEVSMLETIAERTWIAVEKLRLAEELRAREAELEAIITQTPFMLTRCTRDLRYRFVSRAYAEMIGRTPEEVAGKPIVEIMGEEGMRTISPYIAKVLQGDYVEYENEVAFEGVGRPFLHVAYTPDWDEAGNVIGWFASIVDISERKRAEEALSESEQRFREIFETAGVSVWLEDFTEVKTAIEELRAQGVEDFRTYFAEHPDVVQHAIELVSILDVNNETLDLFRAKSKEELLGSLSNVFAPETEQIFVEELVALAEGHETLRAETQVRALDGKPISVLFTVHFASPTSDQSHVVVTLTDITERKRAEEALRIENQRFMRFFDSNIVGITIANPNGKVLLANDYYLRLLGVTRQEFDEGKVDWRKFTPPEWVPADEKAIRELRESGVCEPYEKEYIRADGTRVPVYLADAMLPGPAEEIAAFVLDLTERKRAEESLRASETLYRTIARSIPGGGVYVVDKDMRYLVADGAVTEAFGLSREMLEGRTVSEVFHDQQRLRMIERLNRSFAGEIVSYETEHNGRVYWTQQAPLFDSLGQAIIVTLDITERKHAEEALRESEERFAQFMEHLPGLAWIKDRQGRYVYANVTAERAFNVPRETLYGKTDYDIFPSEVAKQFKANDEQALLDGKGIQVVETLQQADGILHYSLVSKFPIPGPDGHVELIGGTAVDITERKQAEEALQLLNLQLETRVVERTAALQKANSELLESRKRLQFLSQRLVEVQEEERRAIARELHDRVGQTLSALNINLIIMRGQLLPDSLERVGPRFNDSMQLVGETITLVRDVMSNLRPAVLDDYGLEAALQSHMDEFTARYGIRVIFNRPAQPIPRLGPSIEMTFLRIAQEALINIARHANATQVTLSLWQDDGSVCMTIQDNGSGIVSWQEANRPGSHGLTIMRERAEAFNGNLKVGSVPGQGTKVEMSIPLGKGSQNEAQKDRRE